MCEERSNVTVEEGEPDSTEVRAARLAEVSADRRFAKITWVETTGSTNADMIEAARSGAEEQVLLTDFQSAGRGRRSRSWSAPPATSMMMSVLLRQRAPGHALVPETASGLTMALGLAAIEACELLHDVRPTLKWPNDLVHEDRKLAGVLAEAVIEGGEMTAVVIGMGLNTNWPELPPELSDIAVSLNHLADHPIDMVELARLTLDRFEYWLAEEPALMRAAYVSRSATIGRDVRAELPNGEILGRAVGITPEGHPRNRHRHGPTSHPCRRCCAPAANKWCGWFLTTAGRLLVTSIRGEQASAPTAMVRVVGHVGCAGHCCSINESGRWALVGRSAGQRAPKSRCGRHA